MPRPLRSLSRAVERLVGAEVREGEWQLVLLFFANLFLLLGAYYILKVVREPLILLEGGVVLRSAARGFQAGLLLVLIPAYGLLTDRFEPAKLVKWILGGFVACVAGFVALGEAGVRVGFAFFVWLGIFSTLAIAQFWSLASDVLTESEGRRLFPLVATGGTIGGIGGAQLASHMLGEHPHQLMLVAAALLFSCALLSHITHDAAMQHRARVPHDTSSFREARGGLALVVSDRYLRMIAIAVVLLNFINTVGDFLLSQVVAHEASALSTSLLKQRYIAQFYADFQTAVSVLTTLLQLFCVSRVFKAVGVGGALLCLPLFTVLGYGALVLSPVLALAATVKVVQDSTEYSLYSTSHQALFLRTSRDAKYKARAAIDTLFMRFGDLAAAAVVFTFAELGVGLVGHALLNSLLSAIWVAVALRLRKLSALPRATQGGALVPVEPRPTSE